MAVIVAGGLSLVASSLPDGLEWSISKITGATEVESTGGIYSFLQEYRTSLQSFLTTDLSLQTQLPEHHFQAL